MEEMERLKAGREFPRLNAGDSIAIEKLPYMTAKQSVTIKGVVIGIANRASDTSIDLLNVRPSIVYGQQEHMYS